MPTTSIQPSSITNSKSLNGKDTNDGGSIIIPSPISTAETTRSMMRNGTKITKPMMKPLFSSDSTNADTSAVSGTSSRATGCGVSDASRNIDSSPSRECDSKNSRSGPCASSSAC